MTRLFPKKSIYWVWVPGVNPKPKTKINSEFKSIHFGVEINERLKC